MFYNTRYHAVQGRQVGFAKILPRGDFADVNAASPAGLPLMSSDFPDLGG
jgi:hypothetical protein